MIEVDGATLRQTLDGRVVISWPARRDSAGVEHFIVRPADAATRRAIEQELFRLLDATPLWDKDVRVLQLVEAHGTGTAVGDPIEVALKALRAEVAQLQGWVLIP